MSSNQTFNFRLAFLPDMIYKLCAHWKDCERYYGLNGTPDLSALDALTVSNSPTISLPISFTK